jgi:hypothetical protein
MSQSEKHGKQDALMELKQTVALGTYRPDSGDIADAILWKLDLLRRLRNDLTIDEGALGFPEAGQSPQSRAPHRSRDVGQRRSRAPRDRSS